MRQVSRIRSPTPTPDNPSVSQRDPSDHVPPVGDSSRFVACVTGVSEFIFSVAAALLIRPVATLEWRFSP